MAQTAPPTQAPPPVQAPGTLDRRQQFPPAEETRLLTFNGILRSAFQGTTSGEVAGESTDARGYGTGSFELSLAVRPTPYLRVFVEAYWSFAVYRLLWVTADVQWLISGPNQMQGD
jgi:hypothetical protein